MKIQVLLTQMSMSLTQWTWVWASSGSLACCSPWGHKEPDTTERLNWTDSNAISYFVANISFSLAPLCKILQRTKLLQNFIEKRNRSLIEHSVVTAITANKLIEIGVNVQNLTSNSWWNFLFTTSPTTQKWFSILFNPLFVSLIILFLLGCLELFFDLQN